MNVVAFVSPGTVQSTSFRRGLHFYSAKSNSILLGRKILKCNMNPRKGVPPLTRTEITFLVTYATCTEALCLVPRLKAEQIRQIMYSRTTPLPKIVPSECLVRNYFTTFPKISRVQLLIEIDKIPRTAGLENCYKIPRTAGLVNCFLTVPAAFCPAAKTNWGNFQKRKTDCAKSLCSRHFVMYCTQ